MDILLAGLFFGILETLRVIWRTPETKARLWSIKLRILLLAATVICFAGIGLSLFRAVSNLPPMSEIRAAAEHSAVFTQLLGGSK